MTVPHVCLFLGVAASECLTLTHNTLFLLCSTTHSAVVGQMAVLIAAMDTVGMRHRWVCELGAASVEREHSSHDCIHSRVSEAGF